MTTVTMKPAARVRRIEIDRLIANLGERDCATCLHAVDELLANGRGSSQAAANELIADGAATHGARLVGFFMCRAARDWDTGSQVDGLSGLRDLAWLRGRLRDVLYRRRQAAQTVDAELAAGDGTAQAFAQGDYLGPVQFAYRHCVGRPPTPEECEAHVARIHDDQDFAAFLVDLHDGREAESHRKATWTMFAARAGQHDVIAAAIIVSYQRTVGRTPVAAEIDVWKTNFRNGLPIPEFFRLMSLSEESRAYRQANLRHLSDGQFVQLAHEAMLGYGVSARELVGWERELASGSMDRTDVLQVLFKRFALADARQAGKQEVHNALHCSIAFTGKVLTVPIWEERARALREAGSQVEVPPRMPRFSIRSKPAVLVTAIASLYRGRKFIERFMDNITGQGCFRDHAELVIIDADSPEGEWSVIERYAKTMPNVVYRRINHRIGIYDAWNVGAKLARGEYLTNTNMDDLRRDDSLEIQAGILDNLPFVDVAYQEFYYTFDPTLSFDEIARFGFKGNVPVVNAYNMMDYNSPHNAPMWRKCLHDELGYFDTSFKSAGDYEFWMRCLVAGKVFYKSNDPHVVYYQNPEGISTRPDTRGVEEGRRIFKNYSRQIISPNVAMPEQLFVARHAAGIPVEARTGNVRYDAMQAALRQLAISAKFRSDAGRGAQ